MFMNLFEVNFITPRNKILFDFSLISNFDIKLIDHGFLIGRIAKKSGLILVNNLLIVLLCILY